MIGAMKPFLRSAGPPPAREQQGLYVTANQAKVLMLLVETMTAERYPGLDRSDFDDAWAVHANLQAMVFSTPPR
jgi:hypothetical protein